MDHNPPALCASAASVLDALTARLDVGASQVLKDPAGLHMPVAVGRDADAAGGAAYRIGQYHVGRGGTRLWDPLVVFLRSADGRWTPLSYHDAFTTIAPVEASAPAVRRRLTILCNHWMAQIGAVHALAGKAVAAE